MIVYGVYKNADDTEGKGPMVLDRLFEDRDPAIAYMNTQRGTMGRRPSDFTNPETGKPYQGWLDWPWRGEWELREHMFGR